MQRKSDENQDYKFDRRCMIPNSYDKNTTMFSSTTEIEISKSSSTKEGIQPKLIIILSLRENFQIYSYKFKKATKIMS